MPRPAVALNEWEDELRRWIMEEEIPIHLARERLRSGGIMVSKTTLERRLKEWKISAQPKRQDSPALRQRITEMYYEHLTEAESARVLQDEGFAITQSGLTRLRKDMALYKRRCPDAEIQQSWMNKRNKKWNMPTAGAPDEYAPEPPPSGLSAVQGGDNEIGERLQHQVSQLQYLAQETDDGNTMFPLDPILAAQSDQQSGVSTLNEVSS